MGERDKEQRLRLRQSGTGLNQQRPTGMIPYHISEWFINDRSWLICLRADILLWSEVRVVQEQTGG